MALKNRRKVRDVGEEKVLDVDASMQGTLTFRDPVNLRINGKFEGSLDTKGNLTISQNAQVKANIVGENIVIAGKVNGEVIAKERLEIIPPAVLIGNIQTPRLKIIEGATFQGTCKMGSEQKQEREELSAEELAKYLEVDVSSVLEWAASGKLPGTKEAETWRFDRLKIDEWIAAGRIK